MTVQNKMFYCHCTTQFAVHVLRHSISHPTHGLTPVQIMIIIVINNYKSSYEKEWYIRSNAICVSYQLLLHLIKILHAINRYLHMLLHISLLYRDTSSFLSSVLWSAVTMLKRRWWGVSVLLSSLQWWLWGKSCFWTWKRGSLRPCSAFQMAVQRRDDDRGELHPSKCCWLCGGSLIWRLPSVRARGVQLFSGLMTPWRLLLSAAEQLAYHAVIQCVSHSME